MWLGKECLGAAPLRDDNFLRCYFISRTNGEGERGLGGRLALKGERALKRISGLACFKGTEMGVGCLGALRKQRWEPEVSCWLWGVREL